jgi:protein-tyrosine phosphatase
LPASGRIDIHSHLLPGVDDGCIVLEESLECIAQLKAAGYVGSICTPHMWGERYPNNTPDNVRTLVQHLAEDLAAAGVAYQLWPGGELHMDETAIAWMQRYGVPTLAGSRCVLMDFWADKWPAWVDRTARWLIDQKYQPILAHPERVSCVIRQPDRLQELCDMGVWLQGNFMSVTGYDGGGPQRLAWQLLEQKRYSAMALDMHRPDSVQIRLEGLAQVAERFGAALVDRFTIDVPRQRILAGA